MSLSFLQTFSVMGYFKTQNHYFTVTKSTPVTFTQCQFVGKRFSAINHRYALYFWVCLHHTLVFHIAIKVNVSDCRTRNEVEGEPACESHIEGKRESDPTRSRNAPAMILDPLYSGGSPTPSIWLIIRSPLVFVWVHYF